MWGNATGWTISAIIVLVITGMLVWMDRIGRKVTERTEFSRVESHGAKIVLPVPPTAVVPSMTDPSDAREVYRAAIDAYDKNAITYTRFARGGQARDIEDVPAINLLPQATNCMTSRLFTLAPQMIVNLNNEKPPLNALRTLGECAIRAGMLVEKDRPAASMTMYEAAFSLGAKLYEERLTYAELDVGLSLMAAGAGQIVNLAQSMGDTARAERVRQFDQARKLYFVDHVLPMMNKLSSVDQTVLETHFGDVLYFASNAQDRTWRVEAIFSLARYRFNAGRVADQRTAMRVIRELASENDPVVSAAATAAREFTIEQYRMLR